MFWLRCFFVFYIISNTCFSQRRITGYILNEKGHGISFASIANYKRDHGVVADSLGYFVYISNEKQDTLYVSCLGYVTTKVPINKNDSVKIILRDDIVKLDEVVVKKGRFPNVTVVGTDSKKPDGSHSNCTRDNLELSFYFKNIKVSSNSFLDKVVFYIPKTDSYNSLFRVKVYENKSGLPGNDILQHNVISYAIKPGWVVIDLSKYNVKIPEDGMHVSMEWLYSDENKSNIFVGDKICYGQSIGMAKGYKELLACTRVNGGQWSLCKFYKLPNGDIYNPMIRAVVNSY